MIKRVKEGKLYPFTALVEMGGKYEGTIALHGCKKQSLSEAEEWARQRFNRLAVVISDDDYDYEIKPGDGIKEAEKRQEYIKGIYNQHIKQMWKAYKKERGITNADIAEIIGSTANSVKDATQPNKELPKWAIAMLYEWKR